MSTMPNIVNVTTIVDSRLTNVRLIFIGGISVFSQGSSSTNAWSRRQRTVIQERECWQDITPRQRSPFLYGNVQNLTCGA